MKTRQQKQQLLKLKLKSLATSMTMVILLGSTTQVFPSASTGYESDLDVSQARQITQINYALDVAQRIVYYLKAWRIKYKYAAPVNAIEDFTDVMLKSGKDSVIAGIDYVPEQSFTILMHNTSFVEPQLQGKTYVYCFKVETGKWELYLEESTDTTEESTAMDTLKEPSAIASMSPASPVIAETISMNYHMRAITRYCKNPAGKGWGGWWLDSYWCPVWHDFVMPPE